MNARIIKPPKFLLRIGSVPSEQRMIFGSEAEILEEEYKDVDPYWVKVSSLKVARNIVCRFRDKYELGAGNWVGGQIFDKAGTKVGNFSYNGKFWRRDHALETESNKINKAPSVILNELH